VSSARADHSDDWLPLRGRFLTGSAIQCEGFKVGNQPGTEVEPIVFRDRLTESDAVDTQRCYHLILVRRSIRRVVIGFASFLAAMMLGTMLVRWDLLETGYSLEIDVTRE
jgi:hypothetical protein